MGFLDLPSDITHLIYNYYFACHLVTITTSEKVNADDIQDDVEVTGWNELMPLLLTCKQIHADAVPYLTKVTVRVDMVDHYHAKLVNNLSRPHVTQYLVPAIEHLWKRMSTLTTLSQGAPDQKTPRPRLANFQLCLYTCYDDFEPGVESDAESENAASSTHAVRDTLAEVAAGKYNDLVIAEGGMYASQRLARLRPSMPGIAFAETYVVFDLAVSYMNDSQSVSHVEMVSRAKESLPFHTADGDQRHLLRYRLNGDAKVLWRRPCRRDLIARPMDGIPLVECDTTHN